MDWDGCASVEDFLIAKHRALTLPAQHEASSRSVVAAAGIPTGATQHPHASAVELLGTQMVYSCQHGIHCTAQTSNMYCCLRSKMGNMHVQDPHAQACPPLMRRTASQSIGRNGARDTPTR